MRRSQILRNSEQLTVPYIVALPGSSVAPNEPPKVPADGSPRLGHIPQAVQEVLNRCKLEAQALVAAATHDANEMRRNAASDCERIFSDAKRRGESAGVAQATKAILDATVAQRSQAVAAARAEVIASNAAYTEQLKTLLTQRASFIESAEAELVNLAIGIAEQVLGEQMRLDHGCVSRLATRALARLGSTDSVKIRCTPSEHALLKGSLSSLESYAGRLTFVPDASLAPGSLIVAVADGIQVDASVSSQLAHVRSTLLDRFEHPVPLKLAS